MSKKKGLPPKIIIFGGNLNWKGEIRAYLSSILALIRSPIVVTVDEGAGSASRC